MTFQTIWIEIRPNESRNVGPDLRSIMFATQHQFLLKNSCFAWDDLISEHIEILLNLQIVQELLEGTVHTQFKYIINKENHTMAPSHLNKFNNISTVCRLLC